MPLTFNGSTPDNVNWNGVALSKVTYNGGVVWEKATEKEYVNSDSVYFNTNQISTFNGLPNQEKAPKNFQVSNGYTYYGVLHQFDIEKAPTSKIKIKWNIIVPVSLSSSIQRNVRVFIFKDGVITNPGNGQPWINYVQSSSFSDLNNELAGTYHTIELGEEGKIYAFEDEFEVGNSITSNKVFVGIRGETSTTDNRSWQTYGMNTGDYITRIYVS